MTYDDAILKTMKEIALKKKQIQLLTECIQYLENESQSNDNLTQTPEQILNNFADAFAN